MPITSTSLTLLVLAAAAALAARSALAHHSWSAEYDVGRSTSITGTVARVMLRNPHSALVLNVSIANGRQERWTVEWASPQRLRDRGVTERTLRVGDKVLVTGNPHRDAKVKQLHVLSVYRADDGAEIGGVSRPSLEPSFATAGDGGLLGVQSHSKSFSPDARQKSGQPYSRQ